MVLAYNEYTKDGLDFLLEHLSLQNVKMHIIKIDTAPEQIYKIGFTITNMHTFYSYMHISICIAQSYSEYDGQ